MNYYLYYLSLYCSNVFIVIFVIVYGKCRNKKLETETEIKGKKYLLRVCYFERFFLCDWQ